MGYCLAQENDFWYFNLGNWPRVLILAHLGGWQPAGTKLEFYLEAPDVRVPDWNGSYTGNSGQEVTDEDGRALADGLETLLDCTDDCSIAELLEGSEEAWESAQEFGCLLTRRPGCSIDDPFVRSALELLQGEKSRKGLRVFASFCRREGFIIV
jgi:hypothetical protein